MATNSLQSFQGDGNHCLGYKLTGTWSQFRCATRIPTTDRLEGLHIQDLNGGIVTFSKNGDKLGRVPRIWFHLLTRETTREGVKRSEFTSPRSEELGGVINQNRAVRKGYEEPSIVASEGQGVWGSRNREYSLGFKRDFFDSSRGI